MSIIKSFSTKGAQGVESGDMFYIKHDAAEFTIIDCCMDANNQSIIVGELEKESNYKSVKRFVSTHPDEDHIKGIKYLFDHMAIDPFCCVNNSASKNRIIGNWLDLIGSSHNPASNSTNRNGPTDDFKKYCELRRSAFYLEKGHFLPTNRYKSKRDHTHPINTLFPPTETLEDAIMKISMNRYDNISVLWPDIDNQYYKDELEKTKNGGSPNNICPIILYELGGRRVIWMGDLETEFMEKIKDQVALESVDILFAPHHGRESGKVPSSWLNKLRPHVVVIGDAPSEYLNYYSGYNTIKQNSAGDILFDLTGSQINVYCASNNYSERFLPDKALGDKYGLRYLGTMMRQGMEFLYRR